ncbi:MAG: IS3 family transposase [Negativibacillus sp.]|nr:IS3 family transposase [Negativibacillus sp.]
MAAAVRASAKAVAEAGRRRSAGRSPADACGERLPKKLASLGFGRRATPAQKTLVVQKLSQRHSLDILLSIAQLPRAAFYYHLKRMNSADKYKAVKAEITTIYHENKGRYGYRRITAELRKRKFSLNHKTVQRLMKELGLVCRVRMKKYRSYKGEVGKIAPNLLNQNFHAEKPNQKWVTDVTEFSLFGEKLYLSPILGWQYRHRQYQRMLREKGIRQSMSRKGNCLDNAVIENFFGLLKSEPLYLQEFRSVEHFKLELLEYLDYYNNRRIKAKLKGLPPAIHRQQALSAA